MSEDKFIISFIEKDINPNEHCVDEPIIQLIEKFIMGYYKLQIYSDLRTTMNFTNFRKIVFGLIGTSTKVENIGQSLAELEIHDFDKIQSFLEQITKDFKERHLQYYAHSSSERKYDGLTVTQVRDYLMNNMSGYFDGKDSGSDPVPAEQASSKETVDSSLITEEKPKPIPRPIEIKEKLDRFFVGSEKVKETLARIFYEHLLRAEQGKDLTLPKRNLLLIGPSGSGKSYIIRKLSEIVNVPVVMYDASKLVKRGYIGEQPEDILSLLYLKCKSVDKMKQGVVFLDEFDKLARGEQGKALELITGAQQDLLKFIEGETYKFDISGRHGYSSSNMVSFDSSALLIIAGGAFEGIDKIVDRRTKAHTFGFLSTESRSSTQIDSISADDLAEYGFMKECAGRFQIITILPQKTDEDLYNIMVNVDDSIIKSYQDYFRLHGCELVFEEDALRFIAHVASTQNVGARGVVKIFETILPMYDLANGELKNLVVDEPMVKRQMNMT